LHFGRRRLVVTAAGDEEEARGSIRRRAGNEGFFHAAACELDQIGVAAEVMGLDFFDFVSFLKGTTATHRRRGWRPVRDSSQSGANLLGNVAFGVARSEEEKRHRNEAFDAAENEASNSRINVGLLQLEEGGLDWERRQTLGE
jgi:hypothetical protein